ALKQEDLEHSYHNLVKDVIRNEKEEEMYPRNVSLDAELNVALTL
ncbi:hypothetical protein NPIL_409301, partial [Nephila pilipes]